MISDFGNHNFESENSHRSAGEKPYGGSEIMSHRLKASANSLEGPEICVASNSAKQIALRRLNRSKKRHSGYDVVNSLFTPDSAPELSLQESRRNTDIETSRWPHSRSNKQERQLSQCFIAGNVTLHIITNCNAQSRKIFGGPALREPYECARG